MAAAGIHGAMNPHFWSDRLVLVTGYTGFKGSWLCLLLHRLGARVLGYGLDPPTSPSLFAAANVGALVQGIHGDIRDTARFAALLRDVRPSVVFHLAAQSVVRHAYADPVETYSTNVMGTVSVFEALRAARIVTALVDVTSDKCYRNDSSGRPFVESDPLGGHDPYSASKACAEIVHTSYVASYFPPDQIQEHGVRTATARAGNVIGGGDWTEHQLVPDAIRAFTAGRPLRVRYPNATRPWQHVLDCLHGYMQLAEHLERAGDRFTGAWNFGPEDGDAHTVGSVVERLVAQWGVSARWEHDPGPHAREAPALALDSSRSMRHLAWRPQLRIDEAVAWTAEWYARHAAGECPQTLTQRQIDTFCSRAVTQAQL